MKRKLLFAALCVVSVLGLRAQTDVTSTHLDNPSFELSAANTALTDNVKASNSGALSIYGWTETLGNTDFNNREIVDNSTKGSNSNHSSAISAAAGSYHFFMRRSWNKSNATDFTYKSNTATYEAGFYTITYSYILEEGTSDGNTSTGSYMTLQALDGDGVIASERVNAKNWGTTTPYTNTWATSTMTFSLTEEKELALAVVITPRGGNKTEVHLDNFVITYTPFATPSDYSDLNSAISTVEGKTLGFDKDEYAPYNHAAVLQALATAKAIDQGANNSQATVQALTATLNTPMVANADEVNAIWDGSFEHTYSTEGNVQPIGWHGVGDKDNATNVRWMWNVSDNAGLNATSSKRALFAKFTTLYGSQAGYTLPLNAGYYKLSFKYGGWNEIGTREIQLYNAENAETKGTVNPSSVTAKNNTAHTTTESWSDYSGIIKVPAAGNYILSFYRENTSSQNQIVLSDFVLKKTTAEELKGFLNTEIERAEAIDKTTNVGEGVFQTPTSAVVTLNSAISAAREVYSNATATVSDVETAIDALNTAINNYNNQSLNAPDPSKRYKLMLANKGALTFFKNEAAQSGYGMPFQAAADYKAQTFQFEAVAGKVNTYLIYFMDNEDQKRYICNGIPWGAGTGASGIRTLLASDVDPENNKTALEIQMQPAAADGVFYMLNTTAGNAKLGAQNDGDLYTAADNSDWSIAEASKASVDVNIDAGKYATRIFPFKPSAIDGITFYSCASVDASTLTLSPVDEGDLAANTPYILQASKDVDETLEGWGTAAADSYNVGALTGVYTTADVPVNSYVLQTQGGIQGFYRVDEAAPAVPYRAYLTISGGGEVNVYNFGDTDKIDAVAAENAENAAIYNLAGQRVQKAVKGIYIVSGKKVILK